MPAGQTKPSAIQCPQGLMKQCKYLTHPVCEHAGLLAAPGCALRVQNRLVGSSLP